MKIELAFIFAVACALSGCADLSPAIRKRASRDTGCPEGAIVVKKLPRGSYSAEGCGFGITYKCLTFFSRDCPQGSEIGMGER